MWLNRATTDRILMELSRNNNKVTDPVSAKITQLTEREKGIFNFLIHNSGDSAKTIADKLHISESTLRNHFTSIYSKLGVGNRHGLLSFAFQNKLTEL